LSDRELEQSDLTAMGYSREKAEQILSLLEDRELLRHYCVRGAQQGCVSITRVSEDYPQLLRYRLGMDAPGNLWAKGDISLLSMPAVSLVGSRELKPENRAFAREAGRQAALQGFTLISGNARGADREAQSACLEAGGKVISVVADSLTQHCARPGVLLVSEGGYDLEFSAQRALSRNRVIHALGLRTLVAQSDLNKGGTWDGTTKNLHNGWSPVFCYDDGSEAMQALEQRGASLISREMLRDLVALEGKELKLFD
jgi:predicted Rossmann fold nucleotide-binding protein DprA/Smf involved in DNA uptake